MVRGICGPRELCSCLFAPVTSSKLIIIFNFLFLHTPKITFRTHNLELILLRTHTCYFMKRLYDFIIIDTKCNFIEFLSEYLCVPYSEYLCVTYLSVNFSVCLTPEPLL